MYFRQLNVQKWSERSVFFIFRLRNMLRARMACTFSTSRLPRVVQKRGVFTCFYHFDFDMCFAPQQRALFSTSQLPRMGCSVRFAFNMCSRHSGVRFLTSQRPKVLWTWGVLCILSSTCASFWSLIRPDGSAPAALASLLFDPPETGEKHNVSRLFHLFAHLNPLSADSLSSDPFSSRTALATVAASVHKSEIWLLSFPR